MDLLKKKKKKHGLKNKDAFCIKIEYNLVEQRFHIIPPQQRLYKEVEGMMIAVSTL